MEKFQAFKFNINYFLELYNYSILLGIEFTKFLHISQGINKHLSITDSSNYLKFSGLRFCTYIIK
ncbi:hypothetical protein HERIO_1969 [Hepatospora eriocheir]|uniref:Uncharacterized protein n=1 Tax=Hepatospora eriocheir TaxID=1081669 RepID=A0A1X0Q8Q5_9MICR|nr:hypothetical protein HERIO_1969 [Hepatospora eriocheir]